MPADGDEPELRFVETTVNLPPGVVDTSRRRVDRRWIAAAALVAALVIGIAIGFVSGRHSANSVPATTVTRSAPTSSPQSFGSIEYPTVGARCSAQSGTRLQLGVEIVNPSDVCRSRSIGYSLCCRWAGCERRPSRAVLAANCCRRGALTRSPATKSPHVRVSGSPSRSTCSCPARHQSRSRCGSNSPSSGISSRPSSTHSPIWATCPTAGARRAASGRAARPCRCAHWPRSPDAPRRPRPA